MIPIALSLPIILSTFGIIFVAELPDKTAFASLALATKYKAQQVIIGVWLAFVVQTIIAVFFGNLFHLLPAKPVHIASGLGFLLFAFLAFRRKEEKVEHEEEVKVAKLQRRYAPWITAFLVVFAAEWGDLTQLATATLVAHNGNPLSTGIGAVIGLWAVTIIAVVAGSRISKILNPQKLNILSGTLFGIVGIIVIISALYT